jgi:hypothetical protein
LKKDFHSEVDHHVCGERLGFLSHQVVVGSNVTDLSLGQFCLDDPGIFDLGFTTMNIKPCQSVYPDESLPSLPCDKSVISTNADVLFLNLEQK